MLTSAFREIPIMASMAAMRANAHGGYKSGMHPIKQAIATGIILAGGVLGVASGGAVAMPHGERQPVELTSEFQRIEQPGWLKGAVTAGGLGLIGLELWWFHFSKTLPRRSVD